jgi:hypothetical protein
VWGSEKDCILRKEDRISPALNNPRQSTLVFLVKVTVSKLGR